MLTFSLLFSCSHGVAILGMVTMMFSFLCKGNELYIFCLDRATIQSSLCTTAIRDLISAAHKQTRVDAWLIVAELERLSYNKGRMTRFHTIPSAAFHALRSRETQRPSPVRTTS